jgi:hypothetical protein
VEWRRKEDWRRGEPGEKLEIIRCEPNDWARHAEPGVRGIHTKHKQAGTPHTRIVSPLIHHKFVRASPRLASPRLPPTTSARITVGSLMRRPTVRRYCTLLSQAGASVSLRPDHQTIEYQSIMSPLQHSKLDAANRVTAQPRVARLGAPATTHFLNCRARLAHPELTSISNLTGASDRG